MITVLTWYWRQPGGRTQYTPFHVNVWADMVRRWLKQPARIACVTATPEGIDPSIEIIPPPTDLEDARIPSWNETRPQCLRRLTMFKRDAANLFGERFVCMDLDCVIGGPLDPFFDTDAEFKMACGTSYDRPYNGSMMLLTAGSRPQVFEDFTIEKATLAGQRFVGSDQAWISYCLGPDEQKWGSEDGLTWFPRKMTDLTTLMFFPGVEKPWQLARLGHHYPWIAEHYHRAKHGRALVLGYDETLWDDVDRALDRGPYEAVISSPEAASYWPGDILAIASTNEQAGRIARMHGLEPVWCGVREAEAA